MKGRSAYILILCILFLVGASAVYADRVLLAPEGSALAPEGVDAEFWISPERSDHNISWLGYGTPQGIELEAQRSDLIEDTKGQLALNVQYPLTIDLGGLPSLSVGVRDLLGTSSNHRAFYIAATKSLTPSLRQKHLLRDIELSAGMGTGRMDGLFMGIKTRLTFGATLYAELYRRHANLGVALPLGRRVQARAISLDGAMFYGLSFTTDH